MKYFFLLLFILSACAQKKTTSEATVEKIEPNALQLREKGMELLYSREESKRDPQRAFEFFQKAGELNDPVSLDIIGGYYSTGLGGKEKSCKKAIEAYSKAALIGYPLSANNLAYTLVTCPEKEQRDPERAKKIVQNLFTQAPFLLALLDTYAATLAETKETKRAVTIQRAVIDLGKLTEADPERMKQMKKSLSYYEKGLAAPSEFEANPKIFKKTNY